MRSSADYTLLYCPSRSLSIIFIEVLELSGNDLQTSKPSLLQPIQSLQAKVEYTYYNKTADDMLTRFV